MNNSLIDGQSDKVKLVAAGALVLVGLLLFYLLGIGLLYRVVLLLAAVGGAGFVAYQTESGREFLHFFQAARTEWRKIVWPTKNETIQTTLIVLLMVILVGIFLWIVDMILSSLFRWITGV